MEGGRGEKEQAGGRICHPSISIHYSQSQLAIKNYLKTPPNPKFYQINYIYNGIRNYSSHLTHEILEFEKYSRVNSVQKSSKQKPHGPDKWFRELSLCWPTKQANRTMDSVQAAKIQALHRIILTDYPLASIAFTREMRGSYRTTFFFFFLNHTTGTPQRSN